MRIRLFSSLMILILLATPSRALSQAQPTVPEAPSAPTLTATPVVSSLSEFAIVNQVVYYFRSLACYGPPNLLFETFKRILATGWEERTVYNAGESCYFNLNSNIVADSAFIYYVDDYGLKRVPVDATPDTVAESLLPGIGGAGIAHELVMTPDRIIGLSGGNLWYLDKATPHDGGTAIGYIGPEPSYGLQSDGQFLYVIWSSNQSLLRISLDGTQVNTIANGVTSYVAAGQQVACSVSPCATTRYVYYVPGSGSSIIRYDEISHSIGTVYTAHPPLGQQSLIYGLAMGAQADLFNSLRGVWFFEKQWTPCACSETNSVDYLHRMAANGANSSVVDTHQNTNTNWKARGLVQVGDFMFWLEGWTATHPVGALVRLPVEAAALPSINLVAQDIYITQGIQSLDNNQRLIQQRPTFVLFAAHSTGVDVRNVTARLYAGYNGNLDRVILPTNRFKTINPTFNSNDINHYFVFELPPDLTLKDGLELKAVVNPFGFPLEPSYNDNWISLTNLAFAPPAHIDLMILEMAYNWNNKTETATDGSEIVSWLFRAYPLSISPGYFTKAHVQVFPMTDNGLGVRVTNYANAAECEYLKWKPEKEQKLCASNYLNDRLNALKNNGTIFPGRYIYATVKGMPRGASIKEWGIGNGMDSNSNDQALHGYYAGHEIGHLLYRLHPAVMNQVCKHSADDKNFPYEYGRVGSLDYPNWGFDPRQDVAGLDPARSFRRFPWWSDVYDVMTYCNTPDQWLSDYTYQAIYDRLIAHPAPAAPLRASRPVTGDYIQVFGRIDDATGVGGFTYVSRETSLVNLAAGPGPDVATAYAYALQFKDANGALLSEIPLATTPVEDAPGWLAFQATPLFPAGTASMQIVRSSVLMPAAGRAVAANVLDSQPVSPHPPVISDVALQTPPDPLTGTVTLAWNASDADGDMLSYDVLYSQDGGVTFLPLQLTLSDPPLGSAGQASVEIDFDALPGGNLIFRVIASDGINTASADSPAYDTPLKGPKVSILGSQSFHIQYGQTLNLYGTAIDPQDGPITSPAALTWSNQWGVLGSGETLSVDNLPVGPNVIIFTAKNSHDIPSLTAITVVVDDDLQAPPPAPSVSPTSLNWQLAAGDTTVQTAQLDLSNTGGADALTWTASVSATLPGAGAPWVSLDATSGQFPASIQVSADPSSLLSNSTNTGQITIVVNMPSLGTTEEFHIPVLLQVGAGDTWKVAVPPPLSQVFLPLVRR